MRISFFLKIFYFLFLAFNIIAYPINNFKIRTSIDTTFQKMDSTISKVWQIDHDSSASSQLIISENKIFYTLANGLIYCYDFNGNKKWIAEAFGTIKNNSDQYKDLFLTATSEGDLYSINANNGDVVQVIGVGENITSDLALIDLPNTGFTSKGVVFGTEEGNIICYDIFSFEMIWKNKISKYPLISNPLFINDKIIIKDSASTVFCVNAKSGILIWKLDINQKEAVNDYTKIFTNGKSVFILTSTGELLAIDLMLGKKVWSTKMPDAIPHFELSGNKQELILLNKKGEIIFISSSDGKEKNKTELKKNGIKNFYYDSKSNLALVAFTDGTVYRLDVNQRLYELLNAEDSPITALKVLSDNQFIISSQNGKILLYKID